MRARPLAMAAAGALILAAQAFARVQKLPEFPGVTRWLNTSKPVTPDGLKGKVVLVDFWTYSCINCIRTIPHLKTWYAAYHDQGLEIIGVHTPEFHFEKDAGNVSDAIQKFGVPYPVAMDDNYQVWDAFGSRAWPSEYLVDREGTIRYRHYGEGNELEIEKEIQGLLHETNPQYAPKAPVAGAPAVDFARIKTPEIYLGTLRLAALGNSESVQPGRPQTFHAPSRLRANKVYLEGDWTLENEYAELVSDTGRVLIRYEANKANMVLSVREGKAHAEVWVDGAPSSTETAGDAATIDGARMYNVAKTSYGPHTLDVRFHGKGVRVYTLTFG